MISSLSEIWFFSSVTVSILQLLVLGPLHRVLLARRRQLDQRLVVLVLELLKALLWCASVSGGPAADTGLREVR